MVLFCAKCPKYAKRRCKACHISSAHYCSKDCQEQDWPEHKFECASKSSSDIDTADRLVRAAHRRRLPHDMDTLKDYGFVRAAMVDNIHELMDFWAEFIVSLEISSGSIRNWRRDGILCQIIELGYNETGRASRSQAFKWFQGHQWIIDPRMGPPRNLGQERQAVDARFRLWTGLPEVAFRDHDAVRPTWSQNKRTCYDFSSQVFNHFALLPPAAIWIDFGFCVCSNGRQEKKLEDIYKRFFELHTFEEFCSARENGTLVSLIDPLLPAFGWRKRTELLDVLQNHSSSSNFKLVWSLKAAILSDFPPAFLQEPCKPMLREYGFYNVRTADEAKELKRLYRRLFLDANVRPLKLHEVATAGELYSFANYVLGFGKEERALFGRLLRKRAADSPAHCSSTQELNRCPWEVLQYLPSNHYH